MKKLIANTLKKLNNGDESGALMCFFQKAHLHYGNDSVLEECIRSLYKGYGNLDIAHKRSKAILSALLYDLLAKGNGRMAAYGCLRLATECAIKHGYSASELFCTDLNIGSDVVAVSNNCAGNSVEQNIKRMFCDGAYVISISSQHCIYLYKDFFGALVLLSIVNAKDAVLCDEEMFNDEAPLYFTESSHFISPIYMLDIATFLIREITALFGYPCLRIKHKVLFLNGAYPINDEDMWEEAWKHRDLEVDVIKLNDKQNPIDALEKDYFTQPLQHILSIASKHYDKALCLSGKFEDTVQEYLRNNINIIRK
jgi:hypothetical protein